MALPQSGSVVLSKLCVMYDISIVDRKRNETNCARLATFLYK